MRRLGPLYGGAVALVHSTPWRWPGEIADEPRSPGWVVALGLPIGIGRVPRRRDRARDRLAGHGRSRRRPRYARARVGGPRRARRRRSHRSRRGPLADGQERARAGVRDPRAGRRAGRTATRIAGSAVLVAAAVVGRWAAVFLQALGEPILDDHEPRSLVATPAPLWLTGALGIGTLALAALGPVRRRASTALAITARGVVRVRRRRAAPRCTG